MFKPNEIEAIPIELESQFKELENRIMQDIVRRLKNNGNEIIRSADWQLHRLSELGKSKKEIKQFISETLGLSEKEIDRIYSDVLEQGYAHDADLYKAVGKDMIPFAENKPLHQLISATIKQTNDELKNITQSLGFAVKQPDGTLKFQPIADYYQKTLDGAMLDIASGAFDYNTVLKRVVSEMTNSGLRSVDYASGWSNRVPVAARRALMTGFNQVVAKVNEDNAAELGTDMYEISWHSGYRPDHWWGGKWYTHDQLVSICGLGTVAGLCGANCYHDYSPVIPGISEPTYTQEQLDEMNAKEREKHEFRGKEYNMYEATQRQRKLETAMRSQRQKIKLLQDGGADEDDIITARAKYRVMSKEYTDFSKAMGLPQQRERVTIDGLGNIGVGKYTHDVRESRTNDLFYIIPPPKGDSIQPKSLFNELNKTEIGKETIEYIKSSGIVPEINYTDECPPDVLGRQWGKHIEIFARNTKTVKKTASTIIHEVTHSKYNIGECAWAESVCFCREKIHENGGLPLTISQKRDIIKMVKQLYPNLSWRRK